MSFITANLLNGTYATIRDISELFEESLPPGYARLVLNGAKVDPTECKIIEAKEAGTALRNLSEKEKGELLGALPVNPLGGIFWTQSGQELKSFLIHAGVFIERLTRGRRTPFKEDVEYHGVTLYEDSLTPNGVWSMSGVGMDAPEYMAAGGMCSTEWETCDATGYTLQPLRYCRGE